MRDHRPLVDRHDRSLLEGRLGRAVRDAQMLSERARQLVDEALVAQLSSRPRQRYGAVDGHLDGVAASAVVFCDGTVAGDRRLLERLPVADDPLLLTAELARTLTAVSSVCIARAGFRRRACSAPRRFAVSASAQRPTGPSPWERPEGVLSIRSVEAVEAGGACTIYLKGELDLSSVGELHDALRSTSGPVVLDLRDLTFIDARGVSLVVGALREGLDHRMDDRRQLTVRGARGLVRRVFALCGVEALLDSAEGTA